VELVAAGHGNLTRIFAGVFFVLSLFFVYRSFYGMRIESSPVGTSGQNNISPSVKPVA
jgi:K(+)-stimulated pyrophosphate-energized sodium pump